MEVLTIEHSAFRQLISKIDAMDEYIRKVKLEQQSSLDDDWVDGQAVCECLCICDKILQCLHKVWARVSFSAQHTAIVFRLSLFCSIWAEIKIFIFFLAENFGM